MTCPKCGQPDVTEPACPRCGVVFAKIGLHRAPLPDAPLPAAPAEARRSRFPLWAKLLIGAVVVPMATFAALIVLVLGVCFFGQR